ncbi:hypothetical protein PMI13_00331 [Chryseobacterium populi]|uniref:Uncharacterized protein n=1 Tax=Chryseobacterium populi TaxID=1144316 RepID=J2K6U1_9FLAO|nr:hypothetical protein PMI13_00331 [Chryseobacterium populi]
MFPILIIWFLYPKGNDESDLSKMGKVFLIYKIGFQKNTL